MTQPDRSDVLRDALSRVLEIMDTTEDSGAIRAVIREADVPAGIHVGDPPSSFEGDPVKTTEYVLGQWANGIDAKTPFLNSYRNITLTWLEQGRLLV